jgi:DNA-binding NtrC family response regulator
MNEHLIESILVGESTPMRKLKTRIARFGPTALPVLIQGPTGSGKELVAKALHQSSGRTGALVAFNVCAVTDTMFEDALFGHVRGAFTGAMSDRIGYLSEANGGTIFLDEVGGVRVESQAKLLRAIDTGTFRAVGAAIDRVSDFRVIAAANESLDTLVAQSRFRADLFHRLAGVVLEVPALSERPSDIAMLANHFLSALRLPHAPSFTPRACRRMLQYSWPGNVRELKHAVERAAILAEKRNIDSEHVEDSLQRCVPLTSRHSPSDCPERRQLFRALLETRGDTAAVATQLGVHRATIYRRMRSFGIERTDIARQEDLSSGMGFERHAVETAR